MEVEASDGNAPSPGSFLAPSFPLMATWVFPLPRRCRAAAAKLGDIARMTKAAPLLLLALLLAGCVVHTAYNVATAPIRATGWTYDRLTTSQSEADRNRGRRERKAEERAVKEQRKAAREQRHAAEHEQHSD